MLFANNARSEIFIDFVILFLFIIIGSCSGFFFISFIAFDEEFAILDVRIFVLNLILLFMASCHMNS
jgi:hypothetical protein